MLADTVSPTAMLSAFARKSASACLDETLAISTAVRVAIATNTADSHQRMPIRNAGTKPSIATTPPLGSVRSRV